VKIALSTRAFAPRAAARDVAETLERLALDVVHVWTPPTGEGVRRWLTLRPARIGVSSVALPETAGASQIGEGFAGARAAGLDFASATKAGAVVVEGGPDPGEKARERAVDAALRSVHGALAAGAPVSLRNGRPADLLGYVEAGQALGESRGLGLWFDPVRAHARHRAGLGPTVETWADAYAGRMTGVHVEGTPVDGEPDWPSVARVLPRRIPWVVDLAAGTAEGEIRRAADFLRSLPS
jgi:hypothetical protein